LKNEIKNRIYKEIYYKLESLKFDIFLDDSSDIITIARNVCSECNHKWHQDYNQCVFCGSINYFVFICEKCAGISSLTSTTKTCNKIVNAVTCGGHVLKGCINKDCISNSEKKLHLKKSKSTDEQSDIVIKKLIKEATDDKGVFNAKKGSLSVSQMWCLHCGHNLDHYFVKQIKAYIVDNLDELSEQFDTNVDFVIINFDRNNFLTLPVELINKTDFKNKSNYKNDIDISIFLKEKNF
jgi:hypothetical protein